MLRWEWECSTLGTERRGPNTYLGNPKAEELASREKQGMGTWGKYSSPTVLYVGELSIFWKYRTPWLDSTTFYKVLNSAKSCYLLYICNLMQFLWKLFDLGLTPILNLSGFLIIEDLCAHPPPPTSPRLKQVACAFLHLSLQVFKPFAFSCLELLLKSFSPEESVP